MSTAVFFNRSSAEFAGSRERQPRVPPRNSEIAWEALARIASDRTLRLKHSQLNLEAFRI
jgi:hypothetical protein